MKDFRRMSKRDIRWAERIKKILGWRGWRTGCDGCIEGYRGSRSEVITIQHCKDSHIKSQIIEALEARLPVSKEGE